ncbi:MAG: hypothetical protein LUH07_09455 [Lachnospiraceae bacterium]|nr:hypothetical protein [Lachnospiraceae bacterium]
MPRKRANKKIVFIIVEGPSDSEALGVLFGRLFDKNEVHVEIVYGDITSDMTTSAHNIVAKIGNMVKQFAGSTHYKASDFQQVIHLIDMDGAYVSDDVIVKDEVCEKVWYSTTEIRTARPDYIISRNKRKRENIERLCSLGKVWNSIPYRAFYMSANLDHVLYNKINSSNEDKEKNALTFARKYKDCLDEFLVFISDSDFSVCEDYNESWKFIKEEKHSLERHTNLGLCFADIREKNETTADE